MGSRVSTLEPKSIPFSYMDPLGFITGPDAAGVAAVDALCASTAEYE